ncbi:hypothetical protein ACFOJ6_17945 [Gordonia humi]|uniref:hypothetical protein n=1 Tax=Gordonia humi TaxID=686429 RepID=UPI00362361B3
MRQNHRRLQEVVVMTGEERQQQVDGALSDRESDDPGKSGRGDDCRPDRDRRRENDQQGRSGRQYAHRRGVGGDAGECGRPADDPAAHTRGYEVGRHGVESSA